MRTSLSELVGNISFSGIECKSCTENDRCKECEKIIEGLIEKFSGIYRLYNDNLNKFF